MANRSLPARGATSLVFSLEGQENAEYSVFMAAREEGALRWGVCRPEPLLRGVWVNRNVRMSVSVTEC